jgi:hypothetical protein
MPAAKSTLNISIEGVGYNIYFFRLNSYLNENLIEGIKFSELLTSCGGLQVNSNLKT